VIERLRALWGRRWRPSTASTPELSRYLMLCLLAAALSVWSHSGISSIRSLLPTAIWSALALEALWILAQRKRSGR
jgi:hypothetical protein